MYVCFREGGMELADSSNMCVCVCFREGGMELADSSNMYLCVFQRGWDGVGRQIYLLSWSSDGLPAVSRPTGKLY